MTFAGILARAALLAYPADFRAQFGREILADIDDDPSHAATQLFDLFKGAAVMHFDTFARDASYALRRLRSAPLFVAIIVITFALGIGANVAIFSALDAVVLKPLPFPHASSLGLVYFHGPGGDVFPATSITDSVDIGSRSKTIAEIAASRDDQSTMVLSGKPYSLNGLDVTPNYFSVLGISAQSGRILGAPDAAPNVNTLLISDELWRKRFGADPNAIGKTITLGNDRAQIVGVLRPGQQFVDPNGAQITSQVDFLEATQQRADPPARGDRTAGAIVRLADGVTFAQANAEMALISTRLQKLYPDTNAKGAFSLQPLTASVLGAASSALWMIFAAVGGILLIACANVGNLLAARWSSRDREIAVRRALGASSRSIAGQLLVETGLLATIGAVLGVAAAYGALHAVAPAAKDILPRAESIGIDARALLYAFGTVIVATLLAGLSPLLSLRSSDVQAALKSAGRGGDGSQRNRLRTALVVVEIAVALALVVTSGLMVRNFIALIDTPLGVRSNGVVVSDDVMVQQSGGSLTSLTTSNDPQAPRAGFPKERELLERLRALPGVESAALALDYPVGGVDLEGPIAVAGRSYPAAAQPSAWANAITPDYLRTLGISLLRGRNLTAADTATSARVVLVNESFARRYLAGTPVIGAHVTLPDGKRYTIVGEIGNTRRRLTEEPSPQFYAPAEQADMPLAAAVVYAPHVSAATIEHEIQDAFAQTLPLTQPPSTYTMSDRIAEATAQERFATTLLGALAAIALLLALAGIFGVVSFSVTQRSREFGVRIALGATPGAILIDVLVRGMTTASIGVAIGLGIAAFAAHAIAAQLNDVSPFDPATFTAVVALIFVCTALASLQPAIRATRVTPAEALRYE